eukprot:TRINITY_DN19392_c0_g1_i1.p1 TRINITY_DN19392_c0_g1~~TRINITY_DN19392_c0_g1_i1.p1  ORF type:complete len:186 (-),score=15.36 TRINITY_DN19392_c0_g1_i1:238-795(-)
MSSSKWNNKSAVSGLRASLANNEAAPSAVGAVPPVGQRPTKPKSGTSKEEREKMIKVFNTNDSFEPFQTDLTTQNISRLSTMRVVTTLYESKWKDAFERKEGYRPSHRPGDADYQSLSGILNTLGGDQQKIKSLVDIRNNYLAHDGSARIGIKVSAWDELSHRDRVLTLMAWFLAMTALKGLSEA